jgi:hypothetical protein
LLPSEKLDVPRMRICEPVPTMPEVGMTTTPGARALMSDCIETIGAVSASSLALIVATAFPIARRSVAPTVPVTTTASRLIGLAASTMLTSLAPARAATRCML